jgi:hypothetical protein
MTVYRAIRSYADLRALSPLAQEARARALDAIADARRLGISLSAAAAGAGTTLATVLRYAAPAVERLPSGRYRVKRSDDLYRHIRVISTRGVVWVDTWSSRDAERASAHANAIKAYGFGDDYNSIAAFAGQQVGGAELETNILALGAMAAAGDLDEFDLYDSTTS